MPVVWAGEVDSPGTLTVNGPGIDGLKPGKKYT